MEHKISSGLYDILKAVEEIESFFSDNIKNFNDYKSDVKTRRAVERNIEIIGEAINRITKLDPGISIENARNIVGTRNRIIHSYDNISDELIWSIVIIHLPKLKKEIENLLNNSHI